MFEREIKFIYDFNLNKVKQLGATITIQGLKSAPLHPALIQYISAEIDYLIYEDRKQLLQNSSFDYSGDEISKYFLLINEEIRKVKRLAFDYVDQLLLQAASFTVNYLAQPAWSLTKFIFEKEDTISAAEARQIINYVYYYEYIKNITEKYFRKKNLTIISRKEFESLLKKIDEEVFSKYSDKLIDKVLLSMADFFNAGNVHKSTIPLAAIEMFLSEKKLENYIERLKDACYPEPKAYYDISEIKKILFAQVPIKKDRYIDRMVKQDVPDAVFTPPVKKEEQEQKDETISIPLIEELRSPEKDITEEIHPEPEPEIIEEKEAPLTSETTTQDPEVYADKEDPGDLDSSEKPYDDDTIILEIPGKEFLVHEAENTPTEEDSIPDYQNEEENSGNEDEIVFIEDNDFKGTDPYAEPKHASIIEPEQPLDISGDTELYEETAEPQVSKELPQEEYITEPVNPWEEKKIKKELSSFLTDKEMQRIITTVFNEDTEDFALTFERIAESSVEENALNILERVFRANSVKPSSKDAVLLKKIVVEYFNQ